MSELDKYINLNWQDRFVQRDLLRSSYVRFGESRNPQSLPYIPFDNGLELGIVDSKVPEIAKAVSSILTRSLEDGKHTKGGYLPVEAVERVQQEIISPHGIAHLWGTTGHRFVMSRPAENGMREIVSSILVAQSKDTIFFLTGKYNNIKHSTIQEQVDLNLLYDAEGHKWFDKFAMPDLERFKPRYYHQIANFVVTKELRRQGLARFMIDNIVHYYARDFIQFDGRNPEHSQHLLCGWGFWQIGDPPWFVKMKALGFYMRGGAENFFIDQEWSPLTPVSLDGKAVTNVEYNASFGLPKLYEHFEYPEKTKGHHLFDRIPEVMRLSQDPRAKLQYFQAMYDFL